MGAGSRRVLTECCWHQARRARISARSRHSRYNVLVFEYELLVTQVEGGGRGILLEQDVVVGVVDEAAVSGPLHRGLHLARPPQQ
jgi:hypothetical protein